MDNCGTHLLETDRLLLRRFTLDDAEAMYQNWASDSEVTKYLMWTAHKNVSTSLDVLNGWVSSYEQLNTYQWAIIIKDESPEPIGCIGVVHQDEAIEMVHIGYCIGRKWWHQGFTSEALKAVMDFLFDTVGINRIESRHDPRNPNSGQVMKKCGMRYEGTMREADWNNQGICDACYYASLKSDS